ncbi:related to UDP N-acetylglucosamine transporter [Ustilago bromivora]|uniref:Related to UDP N-acetylglucosamine transporter n=1 Tax=Ustilago bromivora TaxID=307758 RepID=A0A1K0GB54_9BASI|nr:related to UDP N-acetylglucosamine transporter [Ustilago bromivora]SYW86113.1 related to UDP N-acetylglucosamine transporter [Ustilago bromivora]
MSPTSSSSASARGVLPSIHIPGATRDKSSTSPSPVRPSLFCKTQESDNALRKWASLAVLIVFTTATSIVSQRSRAVGSQGSYSIATAVFLSELLKVCVGFFLAVFCNSPTTIKDSASLPLFSEKAIALDGDDAVELDDDGIQARGNAVKPSLLDRIKRAYNDIYCASAWMMGVPALVYVAQNMLQLAANSYLSSVAYQGLSQLKLVTAAMISVFLYKKTLSSRQWISLPILMMGVLLLAQKSPSKQDVANAAALLDYVSDESPFAHRHAGSIETSWRASKMIAEAFALASKYANAQLAAGATLVLLACICGGFAGVYIETRLKSSMSVALSVRNAQLASFALVTAGGAMALEAIGKEGWQPLANFTTLAWITVLLRGAAGYVVSATLRYADTIMKGFATSVAIITTIALESILTSHLPSTVQVLGSILVMLSTYNYVHI